MASPPSLVTLHPLYDIVLLKHLAAFPDHARLHQMPSEHGTASLVLLETIVSDWDRRTYPETELVAMISSPDPALTAGLLSLIPTDTGVVFKVSSEADENLIAAHFPVERRTSVLSFTAEHLFVADRDVVLSVTPDSDAFAMFEAENHARSWLEPKLLSGDAFMLLLPFEGRLVAGCFAFRNHGNVWEVGGVCTRPEHRRKGFAKRVVRSAVAALQSRARVPRYQVHEENKPSIALARSIGLMQFLTITHLVRRGAG